MPSIPLGDPAEFTRTGATDQWLTFPTLPAVCTPLDPGDKTWLARFAIEPAAPLASVPPIIYLTVDAEYAPQLTGCWVVDDVVQLGDASAPSGTNYAVLAPATAAAKTYVIDASGLVLADLNDGDVHVWLGWKTIPESAFDPLDFSIVLGGIGYHNDNGTETLWVGPPPYGVDTGNEPAMPVHASEIGLLRAEVSGIDVPYVPLDLSIESTVLASGVDPAPPDEVTVCRNEISDGLGGNYSGSGHSIQSHTEPSSGTRLLLLEDGFGIAEVAVSAEADTLASAAAGRCQASVAFDAEVTDPDSSTLTLRSASLTYDRGRPRGFASGETDGCFGRIPDYAVRPL